MHVTATTLEYVGGNSNKFYRMYQAETDDTNLYLQYGSQNNGRSGGQFTVLPFTSISARDREWVKRLNEKRGEGYKKVIDETGGFDIPNYVLNPSDPKTFAKRIASDYDKLWKNRTSVPPKSAPDKAPKGSSQTPVQDPSGRGTLEVLNDRLLAALKTASDDPIAGYAQLGVIRIDIEALRADMRRLEDYRDTLEMMTEDAL